LRTFRPKKRRIAGASVNGVLWAIVENVLLPRFAIRRATWIGMALLPSLGTARAEPTRSPAAALAVTPSTPMPTPVDGLGADLIEAFTGTNLLFYGGAVAATGVMAFGGADQAIRVGVQRNLMAPPYADGAFYAGYVLPATVAPAIYIAGLVAHDPLTAGAGSAALQALVTTLFATGILKIATGRPYPLNGGDPNASDRLDHPSYARQFRPFQILWPLPSWPSGHTSATVSIAAALTAYYPDQVWIPLVGYPVALLVGLGMVDGDRHWASDVVAGALIGHAVGYSIGAAFRRRARAGTAADTRGLTVVPLAAPTYCGLAASAVW
jgi:membrane-associated phospholipid phosphatase